MSSYVSNTEADRAEMLAAIGVRSLEDLLTPIPESIRLKRDLNLPAALDEAAVIRHLQSLAAQNADLESHRCFLGAGIYDHFRPSVVAYLAGRGEFSTAYTPYQPELSQGMLQAIYEYQTLICALTGMEISNASMYDGASGLAEAALMAASITERGQVVVSQAVHPHYRQVIATYLNSTGYQMVEAPAGGGVSSLEALRAAVGDQTACVIVQHPNFFGCLEDVAACVEIAHRAGALAVACVDPIALGLLKPPGEYDVDIVVGEGQSLGNAMAFGGPLLGFFACKQKFIRSFPGRIVGATVDRQGRRGYTMTLRTREQDIRREKATSNICTNEALLALAATIYLCEMGKAGMRQVADLCLQKAHYAQRRLLELPGVSAPFGSVPFFKEFVVRLPVAPETVNRRLLPHKIVGGLPLGPYYPELADGMLLCVTETKTKEDVDRLVDAVAASLAEPETAKAF
ncbi:MAG TPA: aminomethyl-transferring glycine dehydrogenase subunit GcvPA [Chthonomonadaceae bacterium]|nr:aminomethyl-transferring glycine dehydrogenase subunit GcvPA [Chthonomonadaceae bacterium]